MGTVALEPDILPSVSPDFVVQPTGGVDKILRFLYWSLMVSLDYRAKIEILEAGNTQLHI